jgi:choline dehydrogenase-like flavoprotein
MDGDYDVIIIGTGAGGGTLAHHLAPSGKRILLLERGDYLRRERENWSSQAVFVEGRYKAAEDWHDKNNEPFHPGAQYWVGGNTKVYGAVLFRMRERDFEEVKHYDGISPAWPLSYTDFAPYYTDAERLYYVHGQRDSDPSEPPADVPYPYPPVSHEPRIQRLYDDLRRNGLQPFPLPVGIMLDESDPENSRCVRCGWFDGFPCLVDAKADAHVVAVRPALAHDNVTLLTRAKAERLLTDPSGRTVTGVVADREGAEETYRGSIVVVACGAVNSAVLLLRSASDRHPDGLANSSGVVGRHYMAHLNSAFIALSKDPNPTRFQKTVGINDFYWGSEDFGYPMGHIQTLGKTEGPMLRVGAPRFTPGFVLDYVARHALDFWLTTEDLPLPDNRVTVDRSGRIHLHYTDRNLEGHRRLIGKLKGLLGHLGCHERLLPNTFMQDQRIPIAGCAHQNGTVRFGHDPTDSALDIYCKAHDLDNLYVVDASFFPSSSAVNPALTVMANALRVGDHLLDRIR